MQQLDRQLVEGGPLGRVQIPRRAHHVVDLGGAALRGLHFVAHLDVLCDFREWLK